MCDVDNDILERFSTLEIDCPECECIGDDQYQCGKCGCGGSCGTINALQYIKENPEILEKNHEPSCDVDEEIINRIQELKIQCPTCEWIYPDDDQYTCETCYCEGGQGYIYIYNYLREYPELLKEK